MSVEMKVPAEKMDSAVELRRGFFLHFGPNKVLSAPRFFVPALRALGFTGGDDVVDVRKELAVAERGECCLYLTSRNVPQAEIDAIVLAALRQKCLALHDAETASLTSRATT